MDSLGGQPPRGPEDVPHKWQDPAHRRPRELRDAGKALVGADETRGHVLAAQEVPGVAPPPRAQGVELERSDKDGFLEARDDGVPRYLTVQAHADVQEHVRPDVRDKCGDIVSRRDGDDR